MAEFADYDGYDGLGLAELVLRGDVSPDDLMDTAMARVAARNPKINAFSALFESRARGDIRTGLPPGPFHGVPFALKDLFMHYEGEVLCQEDARASCCTRDEGGPFGAVL